MKFLIMSLITLSFDLHAIEAKEFKKPLREVSVILTDEGYYPNHISVFKGEKVRFYLTSTQAKESCMIVDKHRLFLAASQGSLAEGEVIFKSPGRFAFHCPGSKNKGTITVLDKDSLVIDKLEKSPSRSIAVERIQDSSLWTPRNY